jgi:hypothetical protein
LDRKIATYEGKILLVLPDDFMYECHLAAGNVLPAKADHRTIKYEGLDRFLR